MKVRRAVRDELLGDLACVTASIVTAVREEIPAYDTLTPTQLQEVSSIAAWGTSRVLEAWATGTALDDDDLKRFRGIGAARALDGRPLPVVLRAYRVAGTAVTQLVAARAVDRLEVSDALALAQLWMASIDALSEALYAGHAAASERIGSNREQALADLLEDLLTGRHATPSAVADRSRALDVRLPGRPVLIVASGEPRSPLSESSWQTCVTELHQGLGEVASASHLARVSGGLGVALLPQVSPASLATAIGPRRWKAVAIGTFDLEDLPRAYRLATHALGQAPARAFRSRVVLMDVDAAALAVSTGHRDASAELLRRLALGPLVRRPAITEGLDLYLTTGSAVEAAELAQCHPQTMRYRLRRIRALTGLDPRRPWDRFILELATLSAPRPTVVQ